MPSLYIDAIFLTAPVIDSTNDIKLHNWHISMHAHGWILLSAFWVMRFTIDMTFFLFPIHPLSLSCLHASKVAIYWGIFPFLCTQALCFCCTYNCLSLHSSFCNLSSGCWVMLPPSLVLWFSLIQGYINSKECQTLHVLSALFRSCVNKRKIVITFCRNSCSSTNDSPFWPLCCLSRYCSRLSMLTCGLYCHTSGNVWRLHMSCGPSMALGWCLYRRSINGLVPNLLSDCKVWFAVAILSSRFCVKWVNTWKFNWNVFYARHPFTVKLFACTIQISKHFDLIESYVLSTYITTNEGSHSTISILS